MDGKAWWRSKTVWVNALVLASGIASLVAAQEWVATNPAAVSVAAMVVGILGVILRAVTDQPVLWR